MDRDWLDYFLDRVDVDPETGCWLWRLHCNPVSGYGVIKVRALSAAPLSAHVVSYMVFNGAILSVHQIDHLCFVKKCCNPAHLDAVPGQTNTARYWAEHRTARCPQDHLFDEENTGVGTTGRYCRACARDRMAQRRKKVLV